MSNFGTSTLLPTAPASTFLTSNGNAKIDLKGNPKKAKTTGGETRAPFGQRNDNIQQHNGPDRAALKKPTGNEGQFAVPASKPTIKTSEPSSSTGFVFGVNQKNDPLSLYGSALPSMVTSHMVHPYPTVQITAPQQNKAALQCTEEFDETVDAEPPKAPLFTSLENNNHSPSLAHKHFKSDPLDVQAMDEDEEIINIDSLNQGAVEEVSEYAIEIFQNLKETEKEYLPGDYMAHQKDISPPMRAILNDWLIEVAQEFKLCSETLFLAVNFSDRYLSSKLVNRSKLQLLGVVCMLIAAKFEEIYPPSVDDFVYIADNTYSKQEIFEWEGVVLNELQFRLVAPTCRVFAKRYLKVVECDIRLNTYRDNIISMTNYLLELSLLDYCLVKYLPSQISAVAICISLHWAGVSPSWNPSLTHYSGFTMNEPEMVKCMNDLFSVLVNAFNAKNQFVAVKDKYSQPKWLKVSTKTPPKTPPKSL